MLSAQVRDHDANALAPERAVEDLKRVIPGKESARMVLHIGRPHPHPVVPAARTTPYP